MIGPIPKGTPVNLVMNMNPEAPPSCCSRRCRGCPRHATHPEGKARRTDGSALLAFEKEAGMALIRASKCPDFVLDRGHWFAEGLRTKRNTS